MTTNTRDVSSGYATVVDSELGTIGDYEILHVDAHLDDPDSDGRPDQYHPPSVQVQSLAILADILKDLDRPELAGVLSTRLLQLGDNRSPLYFTAKQLSEIAIALTIAVAKNEVLDEFESTYEITQFGKAVAWSTDGPLLAESAQYTDIPRIKPTDSMSFVDPFAVISNNQAVTFTDAQGNELDSE